MTAEIETQIKEVLETEWVLINLFPIPRGFGLEHTHEAVFYQRNLDLEYRVYIVVSNGFVRNLSKLNEVLRLATEKKCEVFVNAL